MLRDLLNLPGIRAGRRRVRTLMRRMGIEAPYRKPDTRKIHPEHALYPYLLRHLKVERPDQVWAMDITCIPMARGFLYRDKSTSRCLPVRQIPSLFAGLADFSRLRFRSISSASRIPACWLDVFAVPGIIDKLGHWNFLNE